MLSTLISAFLASTLHVISGPDYLAAVQITPAGNLMVLMREAQTTGG